MIKNTFVGFCAIALVVLGITASAALTVHAQTPETYTGSNGQVYTYNGSTGTYTSEGTTYNPSTGTYANNGITYTYNPTTQTYSANGLTYTYSPSTGAYTEINNPVNTNTNYTASNGQVYTYNSSTGTYMSGGTTYNPATGTYSSGGITYTYVPTNGNYYANGVAYTYNPSTETYAPNTTINSGSAGASGTPVFYEAGGVPVYNNGTTIPNGTYYNASGGALYYYGNGIYYDPSTQTYRNIDSPSYVSATYPGSSVGAPDTGFGGEAPLNWALLAFCGLIVFFGGMYLTRRALIAR